MKLRWARGVSQLSALAELLAGGERLRAEFNGGKAAQAIARWEYWFKLRHQAKALQKRGISNSIQARTHCQVGINHMFWFLMGYICHQGGFAVSLCASPHSVSWKLKGWKLV